MIDEKKILWLIVDYKTQLRKLESKQNEHMKQEEFASAKHVQGQRYKLEIVISDLERVLN